MLSLFIRFSFTRAVLVWLAMFRERILFTVNSDNLAIYLKDHLAGSVAALELLDHLQAIFAGRPEADEIRGLQAVIGSDQQELKYLLDRFPADEGILKKAGAWMAEKALRIKLGSEDGDLALLEAFEVLALGIEGKLRLWRALEGLATGLDLPRLQASAIRQSEQVEGLRLEAARRAFGIAPPVAFRG